MKIFIICSKSFYNEIEPIKNKLEEMGHTVYLPNTYYEKDNATSPEEEAWKNGKAAHAEFKAKMFKMSAERVSKMDAVLTLNFDKNGKKNYIGGATFLELYEAFRQGKKIFLYNEVPEGMLYDEIFGFNPTVINGQLELIR